LPNKHSLPRAWLRRGGVCWMKQRDVYWVVGVYASKAGSCTTAPAEGTLAVPAGSRS
jgi:hypothetical protein